MVRYRTDASTACCTSSYHSDDTCMPAPIALQYQWHSCTTHRPALLRCIMSAPPATPRPSSRRASCQTAGWSPDFRSWRTAPPRWPTPAPRSPCTQPLGKNGQNTPPTNAPLAPAHDLRQQGGRAGWWQVTTLGKKGCPQACRGVQSSPHISADHPKGHSCPALSRAVLKTSTGIQSCPHISAVHPEGSTGCKRSGGLQ
eukprot:250254-Chlamydomonas_euryale.AAC.4